LEGDRTASLIIQAAVDGLVDFSQARFRDSRWWSRLRILLRGMQRKVHLTDLHAAYDFQLALMSAGLTDDGFKQTQENAKELYYDIVGALRPWEGISYTDRKKREFDAHRQSYIDAFDVDPLDEKFKEWEARQIDKIHAGEFDGDDVEDDEARVTRLLQERMLRQQNG
jgi:hypothetical protein